ncbi:foldase protein PrsA precursor [Lachnospiraceae bacterium KM106-2]|nr:foldase protein PrsA precursor [Lachnospiraceae bacterium KM106-2]
MNNSKKSIRKDNKKVITDLNQSSKMATSLKLWIAAGVVAFIVVVVAICYDAFHQDALVTVDGTDYKLNDIEVMYNVYNQESQTEYMNQMYAQLYSQMGQAGYDYWAEDGVVDQVRSSIINNMEQTEVLYLESQKKKANIKLTSAEKKTITTTANDLMSKLSSKRLRKTKFTKTKLVDYLTKQKIADKYKEQLISSYGITEDTAKANVDESKYDERKVQLIQVATKTTDSTGASKAVSASKLATYKEQMNQYLAKAQAGTDMSKILGKDEKTYTYSETTFLVGQDKIDSKVEKAALKLKNKEIAGSVIEGTDALYIVKMVDTACKDSYNSAVSSEVKTEQNAKLQAAVKKMKTSYKVKEHTKAINALKIGEISLKKGESLTEYASDSDSKSSSSSKATSTPKASSK